MNTLASTGGDRSFLLRIAITAALGGLLFGYDTAVISGCIGHLQAHFDLSAAMKGWAASCALLGCIVGAASAGVFSDWVGRQRALLACALLFTISAIGSAIPQTLTQLVAARMIGGVAVGAASMTAPMYIAEIAPERIRGRLVSLYQLAIVVGILLVFFVNMLIEHQGNTEWNEVYGWRWMFGSETLPAVLFGLLLLVVPETPRWLMKVGRRTEARSILARIGGNAHADHAIEQIDATLQARDVRLTELVRPGYRIALAIGVLLAVFQQFSGINAVMYYAPEIFKAIGTESNAAFVQTVAVGAVNLGFTLVAIWLVDRAGRRALLIAGTLGQAVTLGAIGALYYTNGSGMLLLVMILLYVASFASAMGPVVWIVISEIFPNRVRGQAMSIATFVLWAACYVVSQTFPMLVDAVGSAMTFWTYGVVSIITLVFVLAVVPETKGRSLEEIEASWTAGLPNK